MKQYFAFLVFFLFAFNIGANSQAPDLPLDSLTKILCSNKWEIDYVLLGDIKINRKPDATNIIFIFKNDKTLTMNDGKSNKIDSGKWMYDAKKKQVKMNINGRNIMEIVSITPDQFITIIDPDEEKRRIKETRKWRI